MPFNPLHGVHSSRNSNQKMNASAQNALRRRQPSSSHSRLRTSRVTDHLSGPSPKPGPGRLAPSSVPGRCVVTWPGT